MNKVILSLIILGSLLSTHSEAQLLKGYGIKAAITSSNEVWQYSIPLAPPLSKRRVGFDIGVYAEWFNIPFFSIVTQVEYDQAGYVQEFYSPTPAMFTNDRIDYLSLPVLAKFTLPMGGFRPYILAGPRFEFELGYHRTIVNNDPTTAPPYDIFRKSLIGGSLGVGMETHDLVPVGLLLELRYIPDFSNAYQASYTKVRNNSYDLWIGIEL